MSITNLIKPAAMVVAPLALGSLVTYSVLNSNYMQQMQQKIAQDALDRGYDHGVCEGYLMWIGSMGVANPNHIDHLTGSPGEKTRMTCIELEEKYPYLKKSRLTPFEHCLNIKQHLDVMDIEFTYSIFPPRSHFNCGEVLEMYSLDVT